MNLAFLTAATVLVVGVLVMLYVARIQNRRQRTHTDG